MRPRAQASPRRSARYVRSSRRCRRCSRRRSLPKQLENVATSLRTLTDAVKEQGQRLARVEKGTGLPNSRTHDERPPAREEDVGWPLDLNRPLDRESVDKATSFHDR